MGLALAPLNGLACLSGSSLACLSTSTHLYGLAHPSSLALHDGSIRSSASTQLGSLL